MSGFFVAVQRLIRRWFPRQTYERGWQCADEAIKCGASQKALRGQACSDLHPDAFTKGWKARCDAPNDLSLDTLDSLVRLFDFLCYHMVLALPIQWWRGRLAFVLSCAGRYGFDEPNVPMSSGAASADILRRDVGGV